MALRHMKRHQLAHCISVAKGDNPISEAVVYPTHHFHNHPVMDLHQLRNYQHSKERLRNYLS